MQRVTYKQYSLTIREAQVKDSITANRIARLANKDVDKETFGYWNTFGELCAQVENSKNLGFDPTILADADEPTVKAAYQAFQVLPEKLFRKWSAALEAENKEDDPAVGPNPLPKDAPLVP